MELPISGRSILIDSDDFLLVRQYKWCVNVKGYAFHQIRSKGKNLGVIFMHRLIMGATDSNIYVDHINHNPQDNRRNNLRLATPAESKRNTRACKGGTSKYKGVYIRLDKGKYTYIYAKIFAQGKNYHLGRFQSEELAALAYNEAAIKLYGDFAFLNKV